MDNCKFENKIMEMSSSLSEIRTDIKWLRKDTETRNGILEKNLTQIQRNTIWRHVYKVAISIILTVLLYLVFKP